MAFAIDAEQKAIRDRVDFRIVTLPAFDPDLGVSIRDAALDTRLEELTTYFTVFSFIAPRNEVVRVPSIEAALASGTKDFCLIQNAGHLFFGHTDLAIDLRAAMERCEFVVGHIRDRGGYFYLDDQCLLINRRAWEALGRPAFGVPHHGMRQVAVPALRTSGNGGALDLEPSTQGELAVTGRFGYGWKAISDGLAAGLPVRAWPAALNRWRVACTAYLNNIDAWRTALLDNVVEARSDAVPGLREYLHVLRKRFMADPTNPPVFVFNSEADVDIPTMGLNPGIDTAFVLAAGFKANRILESIGFHEKTHVVFYDYSPAALALKRMTVEEWDGADFGTFFMQVRPRLEAMFDGKLAYMQRDAMATVGTLNHEFQAEMRAVFASFDHWMAHWRRFKTLTHSYVQIDLIDQPDRARAMIADAARGHAIMWISDMFNAPYAVGKFSWPRRNAAFTALGDALANRAESHLLLGGAPALWQAA